MPFEIRKGTELRKRYVISDPLGSGGFAVVYRATDKIEGRDVAIKRMLKKGNMAEPGRLQEEANKVSRLKGQKNIVEIYECFQEDDEDFLVMEYVDGGSLQDIIRKHIRARTWFDADEALDYFRQIVEGLVFAHSSGLYHRDVKPSNILVSNLGVVKLVDFGIARPMLSKTDSDPMGAGLAHTGTLNFMSPEQASGGEMNHLTDIFSAGIVGYILLTGRHPFNHPSGVASIVDLIKDPTFVCEEISPPKGVPTKAWKVLIRMLSKDKSTRCQSLIQVLDEMSQEAAQSCPKCGSPNPTSNSFCGQCGSSLRGQEARGPAPGQGAPTAEELTDQGFQEARWGKWEGAIALYRQAIKQDPNYARAYSNLGFSLNKVGRYDDAIPILTEGINRTTDRALLHRLHDSLGFAMSNLKNYAGAIKEFTLAHGYNRYNPRVLYHRAESRALAGQIEVAIADVVASLDLDPDHPPALRLKQRLESVRSAMPPTSNLHPFEVARDADRRAVEESEYPQN